MNKKVEKGCWINISEMSQEEIVEAVKKLIKLGCPVGEGFRYYMENFELIFWDHNSGIYYAYYPHDASVNNKEITIDDIRQAYNEYIVSNKPDDYQRVRERFEKIMYDKLEITPLWDFNRNCYNEFSVHIAYKMYLEGLSESTEQLTKGQSQWKHQ